MSVWFQPLNLADAPQLAVHAARIYQEHYAYLWVDGGAGYVARALSVATLAAELQLAQNRFYFIQQGSRTVGFAKWVLPAQPDALGSPWAYLERLYVSADCTGQGFGSAALDFIVAQARTARLPGLMLRAMADQGAVLRFYQRHGFVLNGQERLDSAGVIAQRAMMLRLIKRFEPTL